MEGEEEEEEVEGEELEVVAAGNCINMAIMAPWRLNHCVDS